MFHQSWKTASGRTMLLVLVVVVVVAVLVLVVLLLVLLLLVLLLMLMLMPLPLPTCIELHFLQALVAPGAVAKVPGVVCHDVGFLSQAQVEEVHAARQA